MGKINETSEIIKILKQSHVFVLPSIAEGFGIVVLEAIAAGLPYVATDIPPIREVTKDGIGGLLFKPDDIYDLALKIRLILTDEALRKEKRKNVEMLLNFYEGRNLSKILEDVYKEFIRTDEN